MITLDFMLRKREETKAAVREKRGMVTPRKTGSSPIRKNEAPRLLRKSWRKVDSISRGRLIPQKNSTSVIPAVFRAKLPLLSDMESIVAF
jgi:hypothetical protein